MFPDPEEDFLRHIFRFGVVTKHPPGKTHHSREMAAYQLGTRRGRTEAAQGQGGGDGDPCGWGVANVGARAYEHLYPPRFDRDSRSRG